LKLVADDIELLKRQSKMKPYPIFLLVLLFTLSSFSTETHLDQDVDVLLTVKKFSETGSVNAIFFSNGSSSIQTIENGQQTSSKSITLSESELKSLKKLVMKARPIELKSTYTCADKTVNRTDATLYSFGKSKKTVVVNNTCQAAKRLNDIKTFIEGVLKEDF
jgi:hypothetical protein